MPEGLSQNYLDKLKRCIDHHEFEYLSHQLNELHSEDIAYLLKYYKQDDARYLFSLLSREQASKVLLETAEDQRRELLAGFTAKEIVNQFIEEMNSDDAADFTNELPEEIQTDVINYLNKRRKEADEQVLDLIEYEPDTAGGLMATELIRVNLNWTIEECNAEIRKYVNEIESIYAVYVENDEQELMGFIPLTKLILARPGRKVKEIYNSNVLYVTENTPGAEVATLMRKYDLVVLPVINDEEELVGRITIDDVVDFIKEEAEEDYQLLSGISEDVAYSDKIWVISRARLPWLLLGLIGGIASAKVISINEATLRINPEMAFFIPLIAAMGGNAGVQASAIVVQGLASKTLDSGSLMAKIMKEFMVAFLNGALCALALLGYALIFHDTLQLALTISISLLTVIIIASTFGITVPLILYKMDVDPALATGPFITTTNDLIGLGVYFIIGRILYSFPF